MENEIEKLQSVLRDDPSNFQARRELSVMLADKGFNEEALSNLQYLEKYFPEDAELQYNLGIQYEKLKDFENAKKCYKRAVELSPQEDFYYNLGEVLVELGEWDEAINAFNTVLKTDSKDGNCYFNLGICYYKKEETNKAMDNFQKAVELNPRDIYAYFYLGNIYQNSGLTNFAEENYKKVLAVSPDYSWAYFNLASIAYSNENLEEAKEYLLKTVKCNDRDIEAYKLLTKICIKQNEIEEIISILQTRLKKDLNGDLLYIIAQVYKHIGDRKKYYHCLGAALDNSMTLTFPENLAQKEFEKLENEMGDEDFDDEEDDYYDEFDDENYEEDADESNDSKDEDEDFEDEDFDEEEEDV